jgi:hypothetical protein
VVAAFTENAMLFPVTLVMVGWIMQSRHGAEQAILVMTGALIALPGFALSIMTLYLLAERTGVPAALAVCLLMSLSWAAATLWFRRVTGPRRIGWKSA